MRWFRGGTLSQRLKDKSLTSDEIAKIFHQIATALDYAHSHHVIHRDLKPANILLDTQGNAYLTDFGLAKIIQGTEPDLTQEDNIIGTVTYMSPEQIRGAKLDARSDIYSLGIVLYQMVYGKIPFRRDHDSEYIAVMYKHLESEPPPPSKFNPDIRPELEAIILKALAKNPDDRFQSATEMSELVQRVMGLSQDTQQRNLTRQVSTIETQIAPEHTPTQSSPSQNRLVAIGVLLLIFAMIGGVFITQSDLLTTTQTQSPTLTETSSPTVTPSPLIIPTYSILAGEAQTPQELVVSDEQIRLAQDRL